MFSSLFGGAKSGEKPGRVSARDAQTRLAADPAPLLLDVREPSEFKQARIDGAVLIPLGQLQARVGELPQEREIIVVCASGSRSGVAVNALRKAGYNASNLEGGIGAWARAGLPVTRG
jgi:rhodanese-related sulfurtransferase